MRVRWLSFLALMLFGTGHLHAAKPPAGFKVRDIKGFTVLVHDDVEKQPRDRHTRRPLDVLETEFEDLRRILNPKLFELMRQVPIWVRWDSPDPAMPGAVAFYHSNIATERGRLGPDPLMNNSIELVTLKRLGELRPPGSKFQQVILLHELAHAVHHRLFGFDAPEVKAAFDAACERRLYDQVTDRTGRPGRAYARTNHIEYFAELSCAYLDSCHFFPFNYSDLRGHDAPGFALMDAVWKKPEQFAGRGPKVQTAQFEGVVQASATVLVAGAHAEQAAFMHLDRARALTREGKQSEAKQLLDTIVKSYPTTLAAADARKLREMLN